MDQQRTLGNEANVRFTALNKDMQGKVDTGATTSSLHAERISVNGNQVSFYSPSLSSNMITLEVDGHQEVHSADGGGQQRPMIKLEVEVDGVHLGEMEFNLNDRGNMEHELLIGQNILKAGNFVIDISKDSGEQMPGEQMPVDNTSKIREAVNVLCDANVTLGEIMMYIQTRAIEKLQ